MKYAGFWIRLGAYLVDFLVLCVVLALVQKVVDIGFAIHTGDSAVVNGRYTAHYYGLQLTGVWPILISGVYFVVLWTLFQRSVGLLLCGMRIHRLDNGARPGLARSVARYVGFLLAIIPLGLGLMWAAWDPRKQGWHDKIAGTAVVRRSD